MIVAIDGPAASGKGTIARRIAGQYGLLHLDTGLLYRAVAHAALVTGEDVHNPDIAIKHAHTIKVDQLGQLDLRSAEIGASASVVAAIPAVRKILHDTQQSFCHQPGGAVVDGRDIGTVICPEADVKLYVDATAEVRAGRRYGELLKRGEDVTYDDVLRDIKDRDARDKARVIAPLKQADDAHLLDTTDLGIEAAVAAAIALVEAARQDR